MQQKRCFILGFGGIFRKYSAGNGGAGTGVPQSHVWPRVCEFGQTDRWMGPPVGGLSQDCYFICAPLFGGQMQ